MNPKNMVMVTAVVLLFPVAAAAWELRGESARGRRAFAELKCSSCHSVAGEGGASAPDLGRRADPAYTPTAMASAMWNHVTTMWPAMDRAGLRRPQITGQNAADLYAWFAGEARADKPGDARRGRAVYEGKFCARCHDDTYSGAPSLAPLKGHADAYAMISSLWRHGDGMLSRMVARNTTWQTLTDDEMRDLIAYLNAPR